ncbi:hypothetical protein AGR6A_pTi0137 [Agrobacterium sp. NCPPB 925]|nr:hypothetical protein AGR6A_pTi0137 [Agrobacterium sp. NCPPB 925]
MFFWDYLVNLLDIAIYTDIA